MENTGWRVSDCGTHLDALALKATALTLNDERGVGPTLNVPAGGWVTLWEPDESKGTLGVAEVSTLRAEVARLRGLLRDIVAQNDGEEFTADPLDAARAALAESGPSGEVLRPTPGARQVSAGWQRKEARVFVCGTRGVWPAMDGTFRVACATCRGGGSVPHRTREAANAAAVRDSAKPCPAKYPCGAR